MRIGSFATHDVLEPQNWSLIANLADGVTAGLDVQTSTNDYFAYQDLVGTGQLIGQRAFMTGPRVFSSNDFRSYETTLRYLSRYKQHYRTANIKIVHGWEPQAAPVGGESLEGTRVDADHRGWARYETRYHARD